VEDGAGSIEQQAAPPDSIRPTLLRASEGTLGQALRQGLPVMGGWDGTAGAEQAGPRGRRPESGSRMLQGDGRAPSGQVLRFPPMPRWATSRPPAAGGLVWYALYLNNVPTSPDTC